MTIQNQGAWGFGDRGSGGIANRGSQGLKQTGGTEKTLTASRRTSLDLTVRTAEGDTVTLSAQALQALAYSGTSSSRAVGRSSEVGIQVEVKGNLNAEELEDIREVAETLVKSLQQAARGDTRQALRSLASIAEQDTIAAAAFRYESESQYSYQTRQVYQA